MRILDDLIAAAQQIETALDLRLTDEDFADGRDEILHVFVHEACHAAVYHCVPWIRELEARDHTALDEILARLLEDRMGIALGLPVHSTEEHVAELMRYPVAISAEGYEHLRRKWRRRYWPDRDVAGMAEYVLGYLARERVTSGGPGGSAAATTERAVDHTEVRRYWNENADVWTRLSRAGWDVYRDHLNTPAFFEMLPGVEGLSGLDVGCGEGHNTRLLAQQGAQVTAIDLSDVFLGHAQRSEDQAPLGIRYLLANVVELPFAEASFDFATGIMSFMDIAEMRCALTEVYRVLRPGGFLQFSITHPCFETPHRRMLRDEKGRAYAKEVGDYFRNMDGEVIELLVGAVPPEIRGHLSKFRVPRFNRTIGQWLNLVMEKGFRLERIEEPRPSDDIVRQYPRLQSAQVVASFLHVRARKPGLPGPRAPSSDQSGS